MKLSAKQREKLEEAERQQAATLRQYLEEHGYPLRREEGDPDDDAPVDSALAPAC